MVEEEEEEDARALMKTVKGGRGEGGSQWKTGAGDEGRRDCGRRGQIRRALVCSCW